jgi:hypothetical protein
VAQGEDANILQIRIFGSPLVRRSHKHNQVIGQVTAGWPRRLLWLSVRHQHPYSGPTGTGLGVLYGVLAVWIVFLVSVTHRARSGVGGRSTQQRKLEGLVFGSIWICVYVFQGALHHANPAHAIAYGVYPAVAPLIVVGAAAAGYEAARQNRSRAAFAGAAVVLGAFAAFAGPADVWGVVGIGLAVLLLIGTAARVWRTSA